MKLGTNISCALLIFCAALSLSTVHAQNLSATISTGNGSYPNTLAFDNSRNLLYVTLNGSNAIDVFNTTSGAILKTINLPYNSNPQDIAVSLSSGLVYVAEANTNSVTIINPSTSYSTSSVAGGTTPSAILVNSKNGKVYTVNQKGTVTVIDPSKSNAITTITTGSSNLSGLAINQTTGTVYVTDLGAIGCGCNGSLFIINPTTNAFATFSTGSIPGLIAVSPTTGNVFVVSGGGVSVFSSTGTILASGIKVGTSPDGLLVDSSGLAYVRNYGSGTVSVINPATSYSVTTITVGSFVGTYNNQQPLSFDSGADLVAVGVKSGVAYIDPKTLAVRITVATSSDPTALASNSSAQQTYSVSTTGYAVNIFHD